MAQVDVDILLGDPDFVDTMVQIKRTPIVNLYGENSVSEISIKTVGSIQPASGRALQRIPEALRLEDVKSFWIKGTITATAPGKYSDILVFKGYRYQVRSIQDWTNFGEGYSEGLCVAEIPS